MKTKQKSVAITGAGGGLGFELAKGFAQEGYRVFGTVISQAELQSTKFPEGTNVQLLICDITKESDVQAWKASVANQLAGAGLSLLVNNAGVLTPGPMELLKLEAIKREFDVNVFGSIAVINNFLPLLRQSKGRIIQIGSMTGHFSLPYSGPSSASKAAMESFADVYRLELRQFGVEFVMVQPGNMVTGGPAKTAAQLKKMADSMSEEQAKLYGAYFQKFSDALNGAQSAGLSAQNAAKEVIEIAERTPAPTRAPVGQDSAEILKLVKTQTDEQLDKMKWEMFHLNEVRQMSS